MRSAVGLFGRLNRVTQLLMVNELTIFLGFFMLYPYLAGYLSGTLQLSSWMVGLVLGIRVLSQQGLTIIGGTLADRFSYKPVIIVGLFLRIFGFGSFAFADSFAAMMAASILTGFSGALYNPAFRAYLTVTNIDRRAEVFALASVTAQIGTLVGPLLGVLLLGISFPTLALGATAAFVVLFLVQLFFLPPRGRPPEAAELSVRGQWGEILRNRPFVLFTLAMFAQFLLFNQMYLGLPLEIRRVTGSDAATGLLFTITSVFTIVLQLPVTAWLKPRLPVGVIMSAGLAIMGLAFLPPLLSAATPTATEPIDTLQALPLLLPILASAAILACGLVVVGPFAQELIPTLGRDRFVASYLGFFQLWSGISATVGTTTLGLLFDSGITAAPWAFSIAVGLTSASVIFVLYRRGLLAPAPRPDTPVPA